MNDPASGQKRPPLRPRLHATHLVSLLIVGLLVAMGATAALPSGLPAEPGGGEAKHTINPDSFTSRHETLYLDAAALREQALAQQAISLTLFRTNYTFAISPIIDMPLGSTITSVDANGLPVSLPVTIILFRGTTSDRNTTAMLSLPGNWVAGEIMTSSGSIYLEPKESKGGVSHVETVVYRDSDRLPVTIHDSDSDAGRTGPASDSPSSLAPTQDSQAFSPGQLSSLKELSAAVSGGSYRVSSSNSASQSTNSNAQANANVKSGGGSGGSGSSCNYRPFVEITVDWQYMDSYGGQTWPNQARTIMGFVNNLYSQFSLTFDVRMLQYDGRLNDDYDWGAAFWKFRQYHPKSSDSAFKYYFSGKDYQGCTMGQVEAQPGYYAMMQQYNDACHAGFGGSISEQAYIAKHEIGHDHNADHGEADEWWEWDGFHRTIMKSEIVGYIHDYFSSGSRCSCQDNAARIRAYVSANKI